MLTVIRVLLTLILLAVAGFLGYDMASYYLYSPWTRDARVRADIVPVAPDISGYIDEVRVRDNQFVHKGDILLVIDQDRYRIALENAEGRRLQSRCSAVASAATVRAALEIDRGIFNNCRKSRHCPSELEGLHRRLSASDRCAWAR